jgi:alpha-beta hydrolase superfamily lysophospholipase
MNRVLKILRSCVKWLLVILATIVLLRAFDARKLPELKPWHRVVPARELTAADITDRFTLKDYLAREDEVFREVAEIEKATPPEDRLSGNRYFSESRNNPLRFARDWNRTFELVPSEIRGGALLVHGLSDSPYSVKRIAEQLRDRGIYALCLRMPGHGTVPSALTTVRWQDWLAAVRMGGRHVSQRIGAGKPFYLVGYSNGAALVLHYSVESLSGAVPKADRVVLISPEIGVAPVSRFAEVLSGLAFVPFFEKSHWMDVQPEYIPFKYNSFPVNAARQSLKITNALQKALKTAADDGKISGLPPILAFQSLVDATIQTDAVVEKLFDRLPDNGSELVLFDINRANNIKQFVRPSGEKMLDTLAAGNGRHYAYTLVTNVRADTAEVTARSYPKAGGAASEVPLGVSWPPQFFSLSHVAMPFAPNDSLFGTEPDMRDDYGMRIGTIVPRGEKSVLRTSLESLMRLNSNPFSAYVDRRIAEWLP